MKTLLLLCLSLVFYSCDSKEVAEVSEPRSKVLESIASQVVAPAASAFSAAAKSLSGVLSKAEPLDPLGTDASLLDEFKKTVIDFQGLEMLQFGPFGSASLMAMDLSQGEYGAGVCLSPSSAPESISAKSILE